MLYKLIRKIPIVSTIVKIINSYVYEGDFRAMDKFAPLRLWIKSLLVPMLVAVFLTISLLHNFIKFPNFEKLYEIDRFNIKDILFIITPYFCDVVDPFRDPGILISSVYPSLLGFGIGVYALVFALAPKSLQFLQQHLDEQIKTSKRKQGSSLILNSSMAYPLVIISISLIPAVFQQRFPENQGLLFFTWIVFWYGIVVMIELLGVLFSLGEQDTLDKLD